MQVTTALAAADTIAGIATLLLVMAIVVALIFVIKYAYDAYREFTGGTVANLSPEDLVKKADTLTEDITNPAETVQKNFLELLMTKATGGN